MSTRSNPLRIAVSGATGLVGSALCPLLTQQGHDVLAIRRDDRGSYDESIRWDPGSGLTNPARLESIDAIVHLAGQNIAAGRWNDAMKRRIRSSRVDGTRSLVESMAVVEKRPQVLVCASAIGFYGDRGAMEMEESSAAGSDFLADVCEQWEAEANAATELGVRVVNVRIGVVLSPKGGALAKMLPPFKLGLGGIVGPGTQYWSWIGLNDLTRILAFCVANEAVSGPVNAVSPESSTNREFTKTLGHVLHRPTMIPLPGFFAKLMLGEMATTLLLASTRVLPKQLQAHGFEFEQPGLADCLQHELDGS
ncbi:MAG TPA: TIGR01777 family protein [Fuerstia sp.]|nr:TIGR01777 family protein [Fuerstiella sp.]